VADVNAAKTRRQSTLTAVVLDQANKHIHGILAMIRAQIGAGSVDDKREDVT
jgi:hypothetical protein